jgi:hypothetical protein
MKKMTSTALQDLIPGVDRLHKIGTGQNKGCFCARRTFFYTHGQTAENFSKMVMAVLAKQGIQAEVVSDGCHWQSWPRVSFFEVVFRLTDESPCPEPRGAENEQSSEAQKKS